MAMGFRRNATGAGISNTRIIEGEWPDVDAPAGSVALVNHVTYLTREIVPFIKKLEQAGRRRVLITLNSVPGPSFQRVLYQLVHGEAEEVVPGHVELINVIWELGILPDIRVLPQPTVPFTPAPSRDAAIAAAIARFPGEQWGWWELGSDLERRLRSILEARFDELFVGGPEGFIPRYVAPGREILITWEPGRSSISRKPVDQDAPATKKRRPHPVGLPNLLTAKALGPTIPRANRRGPVDFGHRRDIQAVKNERKHLPCPNPIRWR